MIATKIKEERFKKLLGSDKFINIKGQLLFRNNGDIMLTDIQKELKYTANDYQQLPEGAPYQLINGKLRFMPSPVSIHQITSSNTHFELNLFARKHKLGKVLAAPLDVHFDENNVFQPDLIFISNDRMNILQRFVHGAPDLVIEILSKATAQDDKTHKKDIYQKFGVKEYWIVNTNQKNVSIFNNVFHQKDNIESDKNEFVLTNTFEQNQVLKSDVLKGLTLEVKQLFE